METKDDPSHSAIDSPTIADPDETEVLDDEARLNLLATAKDQDELERDIGRQADQLLTEQADERDQKRLDKAQQNRQKLLNLIKNIDSRLSQFGNHATKTKLRVEKENLEKQVKEVDEELLFPHYAILSAMRPEAPELWIGSLGRRSFATAAIALYPPRRS